MQTLAEYLTKHPEFTFDFSAPIAQQPRIYDPFNLSAMPKELAVDSPPVRGGGRGRVKTNQCRTHSQCVDCGRMLRNDFFFSPATMRTRNTIFPQCKKCAAKSNASRYQSKKDVVSARRDVIWQYIAPLCVVCRGAYHTSAMDMHHLYRKTEDVNVLVTSVTFTPNIRNAERLLVECSKCVPLCSNCHRMLHAGVLELTHYAKHNNYNLLHLMTYLAEVDELFSPTE
jgi:hypothetical protein